MMGYIRLKILLICLLFPLLVMAGNVTITGRVNRTDALVRLMVYDDLLNGHLEEVARTRSDAQGFFIVEGKVNTTMPARLSVGLESVDLYVTPGAAYEVAITVPEADPSASYFERRYPTIRVKTATDHGVYRQIAISEQIIDSYVLEYFDAIYRKRQHRYLDSIEATIEAELDIRDDYVRQHNTYKIASVQMALNADGGAKVIREFYDGKPVLYHCQPYMDLFKDLFKNYAMSDDFKERNPQLTEMITVYQLRSTYYQEEYRRRPAIKKRLQAFKDKSGYSETKLMVANMLAQFDKFAPGADAPDFELADTEGKLVRLSDYKDAVVVLQFVEGSSATVDHQFLTLADLHHQWQDSVQLITISTKDQLAQYQKRFAEHRYDWPLLNLGNDILLLEQYEVHTFPEYFIINKGTKIGMAPAPSPDQTLEIQVRALF